MPSQAEVLKTLQNDVHLYDDRVSIEMYVIETNRRLCTMYLSENKSLAVIQKQIKLKNEATIMKTLVLKKEQL